MGEGERGRVGEGEGERGRERGGELEGEMRIILYLKQ